jgi:hypothetical protein
MASDSYSGDEDESLQPGLVVVLCDRRLIHVPQLQNWTFLTKTVPICVASESL